MQVPDTLAELAVPIDDVHPYEHNPRRGDLGALDRLMRLSERRLALLDKARLNDTPPHAGTVSIGRASTGAAATR